MNQSDIRGLVHHWRTRADIDILYIGVVVDMLTPLQNTARERNCPNGFEGQGILDGAADVDILVCSSGTMGNMM